MYPHLHVCIPVHAVVRILVIRASRSQYMQYSGRGKRGGGEERRKEGREGREKTDLPAVQTGMNCIDLTLSQIQ